MQHEDISSKTPLFDADGGRRNLSTTPTTHSSSTIEQNFLKNKLQAAAALHALRRGNIYYTAVFSISFFSFLFFFIFLNFYARARAYAVCVLLRRIHVVVRSLVLRW